MPKKLIPDPKVMERYSVSAMSLWRWDHDPDLKFPRPIVIRGRKYRDEAELDAFDAAQRQPIKIVGSCRAELDEAVAPEAASA
jgi:predicted DNA-binding transcriptional regulator AlpA